MDNQLARRGDSRWRSGEAAYEKLLIATLAILPLLIAFKKVPRGAGDGYAMLTE